MKQTGNTILVTGGNSGIGLGMALRWQAAGNKVIIAGRRKQLLEEISVRHPGIEAIELDVGDPESISRAGELLAQRHPDLNVLINNAGIMLPEDLLNPESLAVAEQTVAVNLLGTIRMVHALLPRLVASNDAVIMNVSSALAFVPLPATPTYNATKAAVHSFTESLRVQLANTSVSVVEVAPPGVRTTMFGQQDDERAMPLDDFLDEFFALLHSEPAPTEIIVERAKWVRYAEATGTYNDVLGMLSGVAAGSR